MYKYKLIYARALYEQYTRNNKDAQVIGFGLQLFRSDIRDITNSLHRYSLKIDVSPIKKIIQTFIFVVEAYESHLLTY